ncbi:GDP-mannose 4,6-dehydratase [Desertifilum sp. FACHB-1129]|uniref:CDP-paratose 2-epimerase n=2 Tax=Desertifilum tharense IPPAS B-1220 TaxID=1781255 RepID=A0A1E5QCS9_9CYAN|nr:MULTISPECIES: GDP-mannose 4,6-dehydratase [Desertifilum]MDA0208781.1 GDP-mannose 4,6-dehydratase [Cyanobacteria bacterium FC1]MBD2310983.1 GDP-mannose 4,6-dehydratase [Desertifilum sp. FACHB-1129]MBD2321388.1 GDP-mannose 4,6-dehydratase [Desertifilum sp. FACHB-866]MBD2331305.1 GDP-mannose 4,6-dehydratase [Desertifilum sp. FACHB-868]OEJ72466.1 CDP-paratose 2-epimerase [Desertifilum tharense IPPAS B-1220]
MSWLITGGCGFVGTNLADSLLSQGEEVVVLDNLSRVGSRENLNWLRSRHGEDWRFAELDTRDADAIANIVKETKPDAIAQLAGQVAMTTSVSNPRLDFEVNALGTLNILEAVRLHSPTTVVMFSSTNKVYGSLENLQYEETQTRYILPEYPRGLDESLQLDGYSPYGCSKLTADQYVRDYYRIYGIPTVVFRHSSMYGGRQFATYDQGWIGWFCQKALEMKNPNAEPFTISGNGKQVRDVLYTDDLIEVYFAALKHIKISAGQIYNIGGGLNNSLSLLELFKILEKMTDSSLRFNPLNWRRGDQKVFIANISKAEKEIQWKPQFTKIEGLRKMLSWSRELGYSS